jgi:HEAT repeats
MHQIDKLRFFILKFASPIIAVALVGFSVATVANGIPNTAANKEANLLESVNPDAELQLRVRAMTLPQMLEHIVRKTKIPIHYSILPEGSVTTTCVGADLKQVLDCLLNRKVDVIYRYTHSQSSSKFKPQLAEAWILGAKHGIYPDPVKASVKKEFPVASAEQNQLTGHDRTDELLKLAQSESPEERAEAIGALLAGGREGDLAVKATLEQALTDQDDYVRAQAISSFARREGSDALVAIQNALHDRSPEVRMMAVDSINNDVALLQQALDDSDETVRNLAVLKLKQLTE